jgi:hypothetical protein
MRVWINRIPGGVFLNSRAHGARDIGPIASTYRARVSPPRLNGVRVVHNDRLFKGWHGRPQRRRWVPLETTEIRVRTCRGKRR